jgi:hypothetical protein
MAEDKIIEKGADMDIPPSPFDLNETDNIEVEYVTTELEQMTGKELAAIATQYINAAPETIAKWKKADIIAVILNKGIDKKSRPRQGVKSETRQLIDDVLSFFDAVKINREQKPIYEPLKKTVATNAVNIVDKKVAEGSIRLNTANGLILSVSGLALIFDALYGFKNAPALFAKIKAKFKKEKTDERTEAK